MKSLFSTTMLLVTILHTGLFGNFYQPNHLAFPATCEAHFDNNIATMHTWLESEDNKNIEPFRLFLNIIPKPYLSDCFPCCGCNGVRINLYNDFEWPTEGASEEIRQAHTNSEKSRMWYCDRGHKDHWIWRCTGPDHCENFCWNGGYFRKWNHQYLHFFQHYLQYCSENTSCSCFWPEISEEAICINDSVYDLLRNFADEQLIDIDFSKYWVANRIHFDYHKGKIYEEEYYPNSHGMASSLVTYTFFYSQYHQILLSIAAYIDANATHGHNIAIDETYDVLESIRDDFFHLYNNCLSQHPHPKIYYERGMLKMHSGNMEGALEDIAHMMHLAATDKYKSNIIITSEMYQQEGQAYADLGMYDEAIVVLTEAIKQDPGNKNAYFVRAQAYFEKGNFDQALSDYLASDHSNILSKTRSKASYQFEEAFFQSLIEGGKDAAIDFVPSLCHSAYGMGKTLWAFGTHPIESSTNFINACQEISKLTYDYFRKINREQVEEYCEELKYLYENYRTLSDQEKGSLIGYTVGKYGVDIFAGGVVLKSVSTFKKLKEANQVCNLEAMAVSAANKDTIVAEALKHAAQRDVFFKDVKIHWGRQNKHIEGSKNYLKGKSLLQHPNPESLIKTHAGTGLPIRGKPGEWGYQEIVNFKEHIGLSVCEQTGRETATTWAKIHYSKDGAHIVPTTPR